MRYAAIEEAHFRELTVVAVCAGGVETNAGRAGDPATVYEWNGSFQKVSRNEPAPHGTINILLFINHELTPGAMVCAVMMATEAKTAALQELAVSSRYSSGLATGTGTDQIGIAARLHSGALLTGAGKHCVLGELIGKTVQQAIFEALKLQNALTPESQRSSVRHLERFGATSEELMEMISAQLNTEDARLLRQNFSEVERDPLVVAAVAALTHLHDNVSWGLLPAGCLPELCATYGAQLASAVSGNYLWLPHYRETLAPAGCSMSNDDLLRLVARAIALGFHDKWPE
jgi:adenosylcobinamide amidohydrolase